MQETDHQLGLAVHGGMDGVAGEQIAEDRVLAGTPDAKRLALIGKKSSEPIQASRPRCEMHGAAVAVVQIAMALHPSTLTKGGLKTL
jgi:hypothetical protein